MKEYFHMILHRLVCDATRFELLISFHCHCCPPQRWAPARSENSVSTICESVEIKADMFFYFRSIKRFNPFELSSILERCIRHEIYLLLSSYIPYSEIDAFVLYCLEVEPWKIVKEPRTDKMVKSWCIYIQHRLEIFQANIVITNWYQLEVHKT